MSDQIRRLAAIATGHHGAISATDITDAGISASGLRRRVQSGVLERIGSHTYRSPFMPTSALSDLAALVLDCGQDTFVSGPSAAALHGFDGFRLKPPFHVTVLRGRNVQRAHHRIHTTTELPLIDRATVEHVPVMSATRTLIDLARLSRLLPSPLRSIPRFATVSPRRNSCTAGSSPCVRADGTGSRSSSPSSTAPRRVEAATAGSSVASSSCARGPGFRARSPSRCSRAPRIASSVSTVDFREPAWWLKCSGIAGIERTRRWPATRPG